MKLLLGNNLELLCSLPENSVDAIITDPPYGLGGEPDALEMLKDWLETGHHDVKSKRGFMGKEWDAFVPQPAQWKECLRVLKPGAFLLTFAGTRTQDLMALGLRIAGFEIRDLVAWIYGSGFPKVKTVLKPALEPITLARKPGKGGLNIDACRIAVNPSVDDPRLGGNGTWSTEKMAKNVYEGGFAGIRIGSSELGRWPSNLIHDGSEEVTELFPESKGQLAPSRSDGAPMGNAIYGAMKHGTTSVKPRGDTGSAARFFKCCPSDSEPSRFAYVPKASKKDRDEGLDSIRTVKHITGLCKSENMELAELLQKVTSESIVKWGIDESGESITGLCLSDSLSITLTEISKITTSQICNLWTLSRTNESTAAVNCAETNGGNRAENAEKSNLSPPNTTSESQAESAHGAKSVVSKMLSEISDGENWKNGSNFHATVKPTDLMRYLCRLITPPGGVVLDPWMGSGSTGKAAKLEGFDFIGMEREKEYFDIACARCGYEVAAKASCEQQMEMPL